MDSVSGSYERAAGKIAATLKNIDQTSELEFNNPILAEALVQNGRHRDTMEPTWTSGGTPGGGYCEMTVCLYSGGVRVRFTRGVTR